MSADVPPLNPTPAATAKDFGPYPFTKDKINVRNDGTIVCGGKAYRIIWRHAGQDLPLRDAELAKLLKEAISTIELDPATTSLDGLTITKDGFSGVDPNVLTKEVLDKAMEIYTRGKTISSQTPPTLATPTPTQLKSQPPKIKGILQTFSSWMANRPEPSTLTQQINATKEEALEMLQGRLNAFKDLTIPIWNDSTHEYLTNLRSQLVSILTTAAKADSVVNFDQSLNSIDVAINKAKAVPYNILKQHQNEINQIQKLIQEFPKNPESLEDLNALHDDIAVISIKIHKLEALILDGMKEDFKTTFENLQTTAFKEMDAKANEMTPESVNAAKKLFPKHTVMIKNINDIITAKPSWWKTIKIKLPFHKGDYCEMTPATSLIKQDTPPSDPNTILPVIANHTMVTSVQRKNLTIPHTPNLWKVAVSIGGRRFDYFRTAVCETEERVKELLHVEAAHHLTKHREKLETYIDETTKEKKYKHITLNHTTVSLLSLLGGEGKSWKKEADILSALDGQTIELPFFIDGQEVMIPIKVETTAYNFGVVAGRKVLTKIPGIGAYTEFEQNCEAFKKTKAQYDKYMTELKNKIDKEHDPQNKVYLEEKKAELEFVMRPIEAELDPSKSLFYTNADSYYLSMRIALLVLLLEEEAQVHCKSGKDRTALGNIEARKAIYDLSVRLDDRMKIRKEGGTAEQIDKRLRDYDARETTGPTLFASKETTQSKLARAFFCLLGGDIDVAKDNTGYSGLKSFKQRIFTETWLRLDPIWWKMGNIRTALAGNSGKGIVGHE